MRAMTNVSRVALLIALLGATLAGCGREAPEQTGAAGTSVSPGTSGTPPAAGTTAGGAGTTGTAPDASGSTAGTTGGTAGSPPAEPSAAAPSAGSSSSGSSEASSSSGASGTSGPASSAGAVIDDSIISTKVKTALLADAEIKGTDIVVETKKGEVQLSGFVRDKAQIDKAVKLASAVEGVKKVDNKITVKQ